MFEARYRERWTVKRVWLSGEGQEELETLLKQYWEPFAVTYGNRGVHCVWLRKTIEEKIPKEER